jgi:hypothetical protein
MVLKTYGLYEQLQETLVRYIARHQKHGVYLPHATTTRMSVNPDKVEEVNDETNPAPFASIDPSPKEGTITVRKKTLGFRKSV